MQKKANKEMKNLLKQRLCDEEKRSLEGEGFSFKSPTKQTMILVALYKKAAAGDMNAIREIRAMTESGEATENEGIQIIDNVHSVIS